MAKNKKDNSEEIIKIAEELKEEAQDIRKEIKRLWLL